MCGMCGVRWSSFAGYVHERSRVVQSSLYLYIATGDSEYSYTPTIVEKPRHPRMVRDVARGQMPRITHGIITAEAFYKSLDRAAV